MGISQQIGASSLIKPGVIDNSTQRPASPYEGQVIYEKDTDFMFIWTGAAWTRVYVSTATTKGDIETYSTTPTRLPVGANSQLLVANSATATGLEWQAGAYAAHTPTITQTTAISKTTNYSKYTQIGKTVTWQALFQFTGSGTASGILATTLPVSATWGGTFAVFGSALFYDTSVNRTYLLTAGSTTGGNLQFWYDVTSNFFGNQPAVTVASGDWLSFTIVYEAA